MGNYDEPTRAVIFDIDGTLANCEHRRHYVIGKSKSFTRFFEAMVDDTRNDVVCGVCNMYYMNNWHVIICTARPEAYRAVTEKWLEEHGVFYKELLMRPDEQINRPDNEIKQDMLDKILKERKVHAAYDDRDKVVAMWRRNGIPCFQVADGNF